MPRRENIVTQPDTTEQPTKRKPGRPRKEVSTASPDAPATPTEKSPKKLTRAKIKGDSSRLYTKLISLVERDLDNSLASGSELNAATVTAFSKVIALQAELLDNTELLRDEGDDHVPKIVLPTFLDDDDDPIMTKSRKPSKLVSDYEAMQRQISERDDAHFEVPVFNDEDEA